MLLTLKMLLSSRNSLQAILSIALLIAIVSSITAITNYINAQAESLITPTGNRFHLVLSGNSTSISDGLVENDLASLLGNVSGIEYVNPQRILKVKLIDKLNYTAIIRGVGSVDSYLKMRRAYINGSAAGNSSQVNIGVILARLASISIGDTVSLSFNGKCISVKVTGIFKTLTQSDVEILAPIETVQRLTDDCKLSLIEFTVRRDANSEDVVNSIISLEPSVRIVKTFMFKEFIQDVNRQTLSFLNLWFLAIYIVVAATSYIIVLKLTLDLNYEFTLLRAIGARRRYVFMLVLTYIAIIASSSSIIGLSLGLSSSQTISTVTQWLGIGVEVHPFLNLEQIPQIILYALTSSILGSTPCILRCLGRIYEASRL
ncbi:MAG: ABC transporter permease [Candidatus Methanomethylicia archaeon]